MNMPPAPLPLDRPAPDAAATAPRPWWVPIGVALTYGLSGYASSLPGFPPFGPGPLHFQAGVALGCTLLWGAWRVLPAVVLAQWLLSSQAQAAGMPTDSALAAGLGCGLFAALQAWVGALLVRRFVREPLALVEPNGIARFMLFGGFAACGAGALLAAAWRLALGTPSAGWAFDALAGWLDLSLGVCVAAPVVLALAGGSSPAWDRRRLVVALPLTIAAALLVAMLAEVRHADRARARVVFEREASTASSILVYELLEPLRALEAMRDVFTASDSVSREGVRLVAKPWLEGPGHLESIGFSTHVERAGIPAFEERLRGEGLAGFSVFDRDDANSMRDKPAGDAFSMTYLEPHSRSVSRLGLNSLSISASRRAILETVRTGAPVATRSFRLTQALDAPQQSGVVTYQAVYRGEPHSAAERIANVRGVALITVRIDEAFDALRAKLPAGLSACVVDASAGEPRQRLAGLPGCEVDTIGLSRVIPVPFAGRSWELRVAATPSGPLDDRSGDASEWLVSTTGLLAAALLGALLLTVTGRIQRIERAVAQAREARRQADVAHATKGVFLASMGHEIRTPMNTILGLSQLVLRTRLNPQQRDHMSTVERSVKGLLGLIDDIFDYSKLETGRLRVAASVFDLAAVLAAVADTAGAKARDKRLRLVVREPPRMTNALLGDPVRLRQVLCSLVDNAIKFSEAGEVVVGVDEVAADLHSCSLCFRVSDTGIGIDDAHRRRLFQAFEQADSSASRRFGGTGLGLTISQHLVMLMGGELDLRSAPGAGSEFFFSLRFERQAGSRRQALVSSVGLAGTRLLVVAGSLAERRAVLDMAQPLGLVADGASDAKEALRAVRRAAETGRAYDVVLVDGTLNGSDGVACARRLVQASRGACPVALMAKPSGRAELLARIEASDLAVSGLLMKPVTPSRLVDACLAVLGLGDPGPTGVEASGPTCATPHRPLWGVRVLLVEDHDINAELATGLLEEAGAVVTRTRDGLQALQALDAAAFDAVLLDCQMPVMDGYQTAREIRARQSLQSLPLIAMTANAMLSDRRRALAAGMDDHLAKPLNASLMVETLKRWIGPAAERPDEAADKPTAARQRNVTGSMPT